MGVAAVGLGKPHAGHQHLLIDLTKRPPMDDPIPADVNHKHFGGGRTETSVELEPGTHTLPILLSDMNPLPHDPPILSVGITITMK